VVYDQIYLFFDAARIPGICDGTFAITIHAFSYSRVFPDSYSAAVIENGMPVISIEKGFGEIAPAAFHVRLLQRSEKDAEGGRREHGRAGLDMTLARHATMCGSGCVVHLRMVPQPR